MTLPPETKLGKYRIISSIGRGGMGEVYLAEHQTLAGPVAIKVLAPELTGDEEAIKRFMREARAVFSLTHPHIIRVHDVDQAEGITFFAMDYIEGRTLRKLLDYQGPLPEDQLRRLSAQTLSALVEAHRQGVIHRDLKPENILLDRQGNVVVSDFGIAKVGQEGTRLTRTGVFVGSPHYTSPEQIQGREVSPASDLYSWGVVMYEMATGRPPFQGQDTMAILYAHVHEPPRPPAEIIPGLSPGLNAVIMRALAKDPAQRFASAQEMLQALHGAEGSGAAAGHPDPERTRLGREQATQIAPAGGKRASGGRRLGWVLALLALLALAAGGGWHYYRQAQEEREQARLRIEAETQARAQAEAKVKLEAQVRGLVAQGEDLLTQGRHDQAEAALRQALSLAPQAAQAQEAMARLDRERNLAKAREELERGEKMLAEGRPEEAGQAFEQALRLDPGSQGARRGLERLTALEAGRRAARLAEEARAALAAGDWTQAGEKAELALALEPGNAAAQETRAALAARAQRDKRLTGLLEEAEQRLGRQDLAGAISGFQEALGLEAANAQAKKGLTQALLGEGDRALAKKELARARVLYQQAQKTLPDDPRVAAALAELATREENQRAAQAATQGSQAANADQPRPASPPPALPVQAAAPPVPVPAPGVVTISPGRKGALVLTPPNAAASGRGTLVSEGNGRNVWSLCQLDLSAFTSGGKLTVDIVLGNELSGASFFILPQGTEMLSQGHQTGYLTRAIDVGRGGKATLTQEFMSGKVYLFAAAGNWFSPKGASNEFEFNIKAQARPAAQAAPGGGSPAGGRPVALLVNTKSRVDADEASIKELLEEMGIGYDLVMPDEIRPGTVDLNAYKLLYMRTGSEPGSYAHAAITRRLIGAVEQGANMILEYNGLHLAGYMGVGEVKRESYNPLVQDAVYFVQPQVTHELFSNLPTWSPPEKPDRREQMLSVPTRHGGHGYPSLRFTHGSTKLPFWLLLTTYGWTNQHKNSEYCQRNPSACANDRSVYLSDNSKGFPAQEGGIEYSHLGRGRIFRVGLGLAQAISAERMILGPAGLRLRKNVILHALGRPIPPPGAPEGR